MGDIPRPPNCLAGQDYGDIFAGTNDGVYCYGESSVELEKAASLQQNISVRFTNPSRGSLHMKIRGLKHADASVCIYNPKGQMIRRNKIINGLVSINDPGTGLFLYQVISGYTILTAGKVIGY